MNYLAHLVLSDGTPHGLAGNLAGDFVSGLDLSSVHPLLLPGIHQHRAVDRFTDAHPVTRRSRMRLDPKWRHWRGILVDVFYDHLLAREFEAFAGEPLPAFAARAYTALGECQPLLPPRLARITPVMIEHDWLCAYAHERGLRAILWRMSRRARKAPDLHEAVDELVAARGGFSADFQEFFPQLLAAHGTSARAACNANPEN
ncbi:MAG: DUF479 domain-containing protein [Planctomycetes bacterium]|nr:DUF479 domain-containing protein [Planctomycetota bacterium]MCW8135738.1 DUF479 domain-containing protein [Planctomycetota bacterium]